MARLLKGWFVALLCCTATGLDAQEAPAPVPPPAYAAIVGANYRPLDAVRRGVVAMPSKLARKVSVTRQGVLLQQALLEIANQAGLGLSYGEDLARSQTMVSIDVTTVSAADALAAAVEGTGWAVFVNPAAQVTVVKAVVQQTGGITGRVTDAKTSSSIVGAEVYLEGTKWRVGTDTAGRFRLAEVAVGSYTLTVRRFGYVKHSQAAVVTHGREDAINVALEPAPTRLDELVTTATGPQRRMEIANAVTVLRADSIVRTQPIKDVTDLLETRVPGLAVLPTTGAPGDPARLRLRGSSSPLYSNDPIVIVDGVRIYSEQAADRNKSLALRLNTTTDDLSNAIGTLTPSPLDRIDPNSIETIEVLNGPSAATLYGADAANGVIVITTKRGRPGPAQWYVALTHGRSGMAGRFPEAYFGFAQSLGNAGQGGRVDCALPNATSGCAVDSVVSYQVLNDPELTVLGQGRSTGLSATVSGGRPDIRYAVTATYSDEIGLLKLPQYEADRFVETFGRAPEDWMERPHRLRRWSVTNRFDFRPAASADVALTVSLAGDEQGRTTLEQQLPVLRGTYVDKTTGLVYRNGITGPPTASLVPDFYRRTTNRGLAVRTGADLNWRPFEQLTIRADGGLSTDLRRDESVLPRGLRAGSLDSLGFLETGQGTVSMVTLNLGGNYDVPLGRGFQLSAAIGFNFNSRSVADLTRWVADPVGGLSSIVRSAQYSDDMTSYGWYVEPRIAHKRFFLSSGLRLDGGSNYGARAGFSAGDPIRGLVSGFKLPKLGFAWLISDEPFFPLKDSWLLRTLRIRAAYGQAGVQPGSTDRLRLLSRETHRLDGQTVDIARVAHVGNDQLRPERSAEIEWGFDADLIDSRLSVDLTAYRKTKKDAILAVKVPLSVGATSNDVSSPSVLVNIGVVRNTGFNLVLGTDLLRTGLVTWRTNVNVSRNQNVVASLAEGLQSFGFNAIGTGQRIVAGYPLFGYWERPIMGYTDANGDGRLQENEVLVSDSLAYLGAPEPDYTAGIHTTVGLFGAALAISASFNYQDGFTQRNETSGGVLARAAVDPVAPITQQALVARSGSGTSGTGLPLTQYGRVQTVSALRFHSLSVNWQLPASVVRRVGATQGSIAVQGTNLGLITNYRGKDPLVNSGLGNAVVDAGVLPQPREWRVHVSFSY